MTVCSPFPYNMNAPATTIAPSSASPVTIGWCAQPHAGAAIAWEVAVEKMVDDPTVVAFVMLPLVTVLTTGTVLTADDDTLVALPDVLSPLVLLAVPVELLPAVMAVAPEVRPEEEVSLDRMVEEPTVVSEPVETTGSVVTAEADSVDSVPVDEAVSEPVAEPAPAVVLAAAPASEEKILRAARVAEGEPAADAEDCAVTWFQMVNGQPPVVIRKGKVYGLLRWEGGREEREEKAKRRTILTVLSTIRVDSREIRPRWTRLARAVTDTVRKVLSGAEARGAGLAVVTCVAAQTRAHVDHVVDACLLIDMLLVV